MKKYSREMIEELMTEGERNLIFLSQLFPSNDELPLWCYTGDGHLLASTCQEESLFETAFTVFGAKAKILSRASSCEHPLPVIVGSSIGLQWTAAYEYSRSRSGKMLIFVLGPVFYLANARESAESGWVSSQNINASVAWKKRLIDVLPQISVMSFPLFGRYAVMLHNAVNGEHISYFDLLAVDLNHARQHSEPVKRDRYKVYASEQALLQMVRTGNINYQNALMTSENISPGVPVHSRDPLRQSRINIIVFTSLVTRAAIEGGLSPDDAYSLGDSYIQAAEESTDSKELIDLAHAMYDDFIHRVHHAQMNPDYSMEIQKCCDYIALNITGKITTSDLAELVGYSNYYLSGKFKKETGMSLSSYIKCAKVEHARFLLTSTDQSIARIAETLSFNTTNYFIQCFREVAGITPAQYRINNKNSTIR